MNIPGFQFILSLVFFTNGLVAQNISPSKDLICGKKWYPEKWATNDHTFSIDKEEANDYMLFNCDGTSTSIEVDMIIKGKWTLDEKTSTLVTTQNQTKDYPSKIIWKIIKVDETHLVIKSKESDKIDQTLYLTRRL